MADEEKKTWTPEEWEENVRYEVQHYLEAFLPIAKNFSLGFTYLPKDRSENDYNFVNGVVMHILLDFGETLNLPIGDPPNTVKE